MRCLKYKFPITGCSRLMGEAPEKVCPKCVTNISKEADRNIKGQPEGGEQNASPRQEKHRRVHYRR